MAYLPCARQVTGAGIYSGSSAEDRRARRRCDRSGHWAEEDYSRCEYMKDTTRVLHIINQVQDCFYLPSLLLTNHTRMILSRSENNNKKNGVILI